MTDPRSATVDELSEMIWRDIASRASINGGRRVAVPEIVPCERSADDSRYNDRFPVLDHLDEAIELTRTSGFSAIADGFREIETDLRWSQNPSYTEENCERAFLDGYAYVQLTGPDAPVVCAAPRGGFFLMAPDLYYPGHQHAAREVYLILTPGWRWKLDDGDWFEVEPGDLIFHDTWVMHAMHTGDRPGLAFAGWIEPGERASIRWGAA